MHYITGTSFSLKTHANILERKFKLNTSYFLTNISLAQNKVLYTFKAIGQLPVEIEFESCRAADNFLARCKNERVPNYDNIYQRKAD